MTKKHFEALAAIVKAQPVSPARHQLARDLAEMCAEENMLFKVGVFMHACGEAS